MRIKQVKDIIVNFIRRNAPEKGYILCLSGGIDSALVLALTVEAVGSEKVHCLMLPFTNNTNLDDAVEIADNFNVDYSITNIKEAHQALSFGQEWSDSAKQNLMARLRMCCAYAEAKTQGKHVLGTCNLSEIITGYFTKWGDGAADIEPLGRITKTQVYVLAEYWNNSHPDGPKIPKQILDKAPSADLYPGQTDEDEIGSYETLDKYIMYSLYGQQNNISDKDLNRINKLVENSQHKRDPILLPTIPDNFVIASNVSSLSPKEAFKILQENVGCNPYDLKNIVLSILKIVED